MSGSNSIVTARQTRIGRDALRVDAAEHPGWVPATERAPVVGEDVMCAEGLARLIRVLGRTGDGSRLLELALPDRPKHPFFAAASNVLIPAVASNVVAPAT